MHTPISMVYVDIPIVQAVYINTPTYARLNTVLNGNDPAL